MIQSRELADREDDFRSAISELLKVADPELHTYGDTLNDAIVRVFRARDACVAQARKDTWDRAERCIKI